MILDGFVASSMLYSWIMLDCFSGHSFGKFWQVRDIEHAFNRKKGTIVNKSH